MSAPDPTVSRAALEAARVVFGRVTEGSPSPGVLDVRVASAWDAAEGVLHALTGRSELHGQSLVGEARRVERLSLVEAHWLIELHAVAERAQAADDVGDNAGSNVATALRNALRALESAVITADPTKPPLDPFPLPREEPPAPQLPYKLESQQIPGPRPSATRNTPLLEQIATPPQRRRFVGSPGFILAVIAVVLLGSAGAWYANRGASSSDFDEGVAAYQRGAREVARQSFAKAARAVPNDERALMFLGRLAREEGNLPTARRFLDAAIRISPSSALANRELASVLLADGNPEVARRFYVRALQLDPSDRLAQGFLGCALHRLGRPDEAKRWTDRAGPGDWEPCVNAPAPTAKTSVTTPSEPPRP